MLITCDVDKYVTYIIKKEIIIILCKERQNLLFIPYKHKKTFKIKNYRDYLSKNKKLSTTYKQYIDNIM